jgi:hypothetical protein
VLEPLLLSKDEAPDIRVLTICTDDEHEIARGPAGEADANAACILLKSGDRIPELYTRLCSWCLQDRYQIPPHDLDMALGNFD